MSWEDIGDLGRQIKVEIEASTREEVTKVADRFQKLAVGGRPGLAFPVLTGRFRSSLEFYVRQPPSGEGQPADQPFYAPPGQDQIDAEMRGWKPGDEAGFVDQVPYAGKLADGHSQKWPEGSLDLLVEEAAKA